MAQLDLKTVECILNSKHPVQDCREGQTSWLIHNVLSGIGFVPEGFFSLITLISPSLYPNFLTKSPCPLQMMQSTSIFSPS